MASIPCAIELEPKTLNPGQINHARELAVVFQQIEPQGVPNLFIQGVEQVDQVEAFRQMAEGNDGSPVEKSMVDGSSKGMENAMKKQSHNCLCTNIFIDSPDEIISQKEPLTAPF